MTLLGSTKASTPNLLNSSPKTLPLNHHNPEDVPNIVYIYVQTSLSVEGLHTYTYIICKQQTSELYLSIFLHLFEVRLWRKQAKQVILSTQQRFSVPPGGSQADEIYNPSTGSGLTPGASSQLYVPGKPPKEGGPEGF